MAKQLLNDTQAAKHLGITKELLYAYIKNAPKTQLGHDRKLQTIIKDGRNYFDFDELQAFDTYLKEPWSKPGEKRPPIPKYIDDYLRAEIKGQCPITGKGAPLDNAHIVDYSISLSHHHHNLIRIAKDEHTKADTGILPKSILLAYKQQLVDKIRNELSAEDNIYLHTLKPPLPHPFFVGRDFELANLIALMETERVVVIQGIGGIGKTQLLLNALQQVCYHNPVIYINIETINDVKDLVILLQNSLYEITGKQSSQSLIDELRGLPVTFIFDSLEKLLISQRDEVEDLINNLLIHTAEVQLLITSQIDLSIFDYEQHKIQLSGIDDSPILIILKHLLPDNIALSNDDINWILNFCNGHPLSIKLLASLIKFLGNTSKAIERIEQQDNLEQPLRRIHNKSTSLDKCLSTVFDCLTSQEKAFLLLVKCYPAGMNLERYQLKHKNQDIVTIVATIKQFFFLENYLGEFETERVAIPNPIRPFISAMAKKFDGDIETIELNAYEQIMVEAMVYDTYYVEGWRDGPAEIGIMKLDEELPNILEAFHYASAKIAGLKDKISKKERKYVVMVMGLSSAMGKFCFTRGYFDYGTMFARAGIRANLLLGEINLVAQQYMYLAQIFDRQFDVENFKTTVAEMEEIAQRTGNIEMHVNASWAKGRLAIETGDWANAKIFLKKALDLLNSEPADKVGQKRHSKNSDIDQEAISGNTALLLSELGKVYEFSGDLKQAIPYYTKAITIQEQYNDETNLLSSYHHLGFCLVHTGHVDEGLKLFFITIEGFYRNRQYEYLGNSLSEIGRIISDRPEALNNESLTEERIKAALGSLCEQLKDSYQRLCLNMDSGAALNAMPNQLQGKLLYTMMLVSVLPCRGLLWRYMVNLIDIFKKEENNKSLLIPIIVTSHIVGGVDDWRDSANKEEIIEQLCLYCLILNGGPDINGKTKIFQWLAFWMNQVKLRNNITPQEMWDEALVITKLKGKL